MVKCQTGFITFIVRPTFEAWGAYVPALHSLCMPHVQANLALWTAETCGLKPDACFVDEAKEGWDVAASPACWRLKPGVAEFSYPEGLRGTEGQQETEGQHDSEHGQEEDEDNEC